MFFLVSKHNTAKENFDREKIKKTFARASVGYEEKCSFDQVQKELEKYLMDDIATKDITHLLIKTCINLISLENTHRQLIAGRILTMDLYKQAGRNRNMSIDQIYNEQSYFDHVQDYIRKNRYYKDLMSYYTEQEIRTAGAHLSKHSQTFA